jgi:hypothetical protein
MKNSLSYADGILRIIKKAADLNIIFPREAWFKGSSNAKNDESRGIQLLDTRFGDAVMDHIEDSNIKYVYRLLEAAESKPDWHVIEYSQDTVFQDLWEYIEAARSRDLCIKKIDKMADEEEVSIRYEQISSDETFVYGNAHLSAIIRRIHFSNSTGNGDLEYSANKMLQRITTNIKKKDLLDRLGRFCSTYNFIDSAFHYDEGIYEHLQHHLVSNINSLSIAMRSAFDRIDLKISKGHSQELVAAFFGAESWNHLCAIYNQTRDVAIEPIVIKRFTKTECENIYFKHAPEAFVYYFNNVDERCDMQFSMRKMQNGFCVSQPPKTKAEHFTENYNYNKCAFVLSSLYQIDFHDGPI